MPHVIAEKRWAVVRLRCEERCLPPVREPRGVVKSAGRELTVELSDESPQLGPALRRGPPLAGFLAANTTPPEIEIEPAALLEERGHYRAVGSCPASHARIALQRNATRPRGLT